MRKLVKSSNVPSTLQSAPVPTCPEEVLESFYKAPDVRRQLALDQFYKCAYCECAIPLKYNDVDHYRPKSIYYWLGHQWKNLFFACNACNRTYKKDLFPLGDETKRGDVREEKPLIVNPYEDDPSQHIRFNRYVAIGITEAGRKTINTFHLNDRFSRPEMLEGRKQLYAAYELEFQKINKAKKLLERSDLSEEDILDIKDLIALSQKSILQLTAAPVAYSGMLLAQIQ